MEFDGLSNRVIRCAIEVHRLLGPRMLKAAYERCLAHEMDLVGLKYRMHHPLSFEYKGVCLDCGYRVDLLVEDRLIVELKSAEEANGLQEAQLLTYMRMSGVRIGLLMNFQASVLRYGIKQFSLEQPARSSIPSGRR
jgi:GxxExxY protein